MSRISSLLLAIAATLIFSNFAIAIPTLPLNTGYNHSSFGLAAYSTVTSNASTIRDDYWINIASAPNTPAGSAYVVWQVAPWALALPNTNWISAWNTNNSPLGTNVTNPAYTIFKKCFCLQPEFRDAKINISGRADDYIEIWLNNLTNKVLNGTWGNLANPPWSAMHTQGFRVGTNCLYALVEDQGGLMGFDLEGTVEAYGLLPTIAKGVDSSFEPCSCGRIPITRKKQQVEEQIHDEDQEIERQTFDEDREMIREILEIREARRSGRRNQ